LWKIHFTKPKTHCVDQSGLTSAHNAAVSKACKQKRSSSSWLGRIEGRCSQNTAI